MWKFLQNSQKNTCDRVSSSKKLYLTLSVPEKLKNSIFEKPIIPQTLNINNLRITSAKAINLHIIRKIIEYSLKNCLLKEMFSLTVFEIVLFKGRSVLSPAQRVTGSERVKKYSFLEKEGPFLDALLKMLYYPVEHKTGASVK